MFCVRFDGEFGMRFESLSNKRSQENKTEEGSGTICPLGGYLQ